MRQTKGEHGCHLLAQAKIAVLWGSGGGGCMCKTVGCRLEAGKFLDHLLQHRLHLLSDNTHRLRHTCDINNIPSHEPAQINCNLTKSKPRSRQNRSPFYTTRSHTPHV